MKRILGYLICSTLFIVGCMSIEKATNKVIADKDATNVVLKLHPCKEVADSVISLTDTLLHTDTITNVGYFIDSVTKWRYDTIRKIITATKLIHKTDSIFGIDQRKLDVLNNSIQVRDNQIIGLDQQLSDKSAENKAKDKWLYLFIGLFVIDCIYLAFKLFVKLCKNTR